MYDELIKALRCNADCDKFFAEHGNSCTDCPMPYKSNNQRACVNFDTTILPQVADALTELCEDVEWLKESSKMIENKAKDVLAENISLRAERDAYKKAVEKPNVTERDE